MRWGARQAASLLCDTCGVAGVGHPWGVGLRSGDCLFTKLRMSRMVLVGCVSTGNAYITACMRCVCGFVSTGLGDTLYTTT